MQLNSVNFRKISRIVHRDLSFFFSGLIFIYALSGLFMNHLDTINPNYNITKTEYTIDFDVNKRITKEEVVEKILIPISESKSYTKHYFPKEGELKVFLKGGSNVVVNGREVVYESVKRRTFLSNIVKLHYNPGRWWTIFSDIFAVSLMVITVTGLVMIKGKKGLIGRGGIELIAGILIPLLFILLY